MRTTRLPPTWAAVDTTISDKKTSRLSCNSHDASANSRNNWGGIDNTLEHSEKEITASTRLEYVNCVTGERTPRHPGMSYFLAEVESERSKNKRSQEVIVLSAASTEGISSGGSSGGSSDNHNSNNMDHSSSIIGGGIDLTLQSPTVRHPQPAGTHVGEGSGDVANIDTREDNTMDDDHSVSNNFRYCCTLLGEWREITCRTSMYSLLLCCWLHMMLRGDFLHVGCRMGRRVV